MNEREVIEQQIETLFTADLDAVSFSNRLFQQGSGLFNRLAASVDRRTIIESDLWKRAKNRLRELEARDLERFREVVKKVEEHRKPGSYVLRLEPVTAK